MFICASLYIFHFNRYQQIYTRGVIASYVLAAAHPLSSLHLLCWHWELLNVDMHIFDIMVIHNNQAFPTIYIFIPLTTSKVKHVFMNLSTNQQQFCYDLLVHITAKFYLSASIILINKVIVFTQIANILSQSQILSMVFFFYSESLNFFAIRQSFPILLIIISESVTYHIVVNYFLFGKYCVYLHLPYSIQVPPCF